MRWTLLVLLSACGTGNDAVVDDTDPLVGDSDPRLPAPADPKPYSGGTCPELSGTVRGFESGGRARELIVHLPSDPEGAGVLFLWHGNGDTMANFDAAMGGAALADQLGVVVVVPEDIAANPAIDWGVPPSDPTRDATFFDDVLSCLHQAHGLDLSRVYTSGFSAGALWSSWLVMHRAEHLAAAVIFSGGSDGDLAGQRVNPYAAPAWPIPVLLTHGGPNDRVAVAFPAMTQSLATRLRADGSTAVVCPHGAGHVVPAGYAAWAWPFLEAHRHKDSPSPYGDGADPSGNLPGSCVWE